MRHLARTLRSCGIVLVLCASAGAGPATVRRDVAPENPQEYLLRRALADKTVSWLQTSDADAGRQCDKSAESLLAVDKPSALSYFTAAQSAWLRGQPQLAIARLRKAVEERGDQSAPTNVIMPVRVVGPLWIATIARYSGSMTLARDEYKKLLATLSENVQENGADMLFVYLHLAELEADHFKNPKEALAHLQAADALSASNRGERPPGIMGQWIRYERTKLVNGKAQANRELLGEGDMMSMPIFVSIHANLMGLTGNPLREWCSSSVKRDLIPEAIVKLVLESDVSKIDKMFGQFSAACYYEKRNAPEAVKRHMELFDSDSFISPVAGLYAARIQKNGGRAADARDIFERVSARYPQFSSLARDLEKAEK